MSRFKKGDKREMPGITSSSLSDIVFMLLFFFMVTTQMRDTEQKVVRDCIPQNISEAEPKDVGKRR